MGGYGLREVRRRYSALISASQPASDGRFEVSVTGDAGDSHCMRLFTGLPVLRLVQCDDSEGFLLEYLFTRTSLDKFMHAYYGLSLPRKLWVMGYKGFMGYVGDFPASQLGRWDFLWVMGGYGLREVWVIRVSTVHIF